jgi:hypothetical protein
VAGLIVQFVEERAMVMEYRVVPVSPLHLVIIVGIFLGAIVLPIVVGLLIVWRVRRGKPTTPVVMAEVVEDEERK